MKDVESCIVVTGAAGGIGSAVVRRLAASGGSVVAVDADSGALGRLCDAAGGTVVPFACDISAAGGLSEITAFVKGRFAHVSGFVHAAGTDEAAPLSMARRDSMRRMFDVHAAFAMEFLGWLAKKGNSAPCASCVLISSLSAHEGAKGHVAYAAAKGAVEGMLRPAAAELAGKGIRLNAVVLGVVDTGMSRRWLDKLEIAQRSALEESYPFGFGTPDDAAAAVAFLLSGDARWITGQTLVCDGGRMCSR